MNIPNTKAAMAFAGFLRDITRIVEGAVENDDATLLLYAIAALEAVSSPTNERSQLIVRTMLLSQSTRVMLDALAVDAPPVIDGAIELLGDLLMQSLLDLKAAG